MLKKGVLKLFTTRLSVMDFTRENINKLIDSLSEEDYEALSNFIIELLRRREVDRRDTKFEFPSQDTL